MDAVAKDLLAGSIGGATGIIAGQPLDVVKVRQQMAKAGSREANLSLVKLFADVVQREGPSALFKGVVAPVASQGAFTSLSFAGFNYSLLALNQSAGLSRNSNAISAEMSPMSHVFIAGSFGGALTTLITTPCELIKVNLQIDHSKGPSTGGVRRLIRQRWASGGIGALYSGFGITIIRDTPATGLYFLVYYGCKQWLLGIGGGNSSRDPSQLGMWGRTAAELVSGGAAGVLSWMSIIPIDVVKTRIQTDACLKPSEKRYHGVLDCASSILRAEGVAGFTRGSLPLLLRAFPVSAITFFTYERIISLLTV